jgi:lipopolysaccharide exporter
MSQGGPSFPRDRAVAAARSNVVMSPLGVGIGLVATVVVARVLSLDEFAIYAVVLALRRTISFFTDLGTGAASTRVFAELHHIGAKRQARRLYYRMLLIRGLVLLAFAAVILLAPGMFTRLLGLNDDESFLLPYITALGIGEAASVFASYVLFGTFSQSILNVLLVLNSAGQAMLVIIAAASHLGLNGIVGALAVGSIVKAVTLNVAALRSLSRMEDRESELPHVTGAYARVAGSAFLAKISTWVHSRDLVSVFAIAANERTQLASFALAYDLAQQVLTAVVAPTRGLILPTFSVLRSTEPSRGDLLRQATRGVGLLVVPTAAALAAASPAVIAVFFGRKFDDAVPYLVLVTCGMAVELVLSIPATSYMLADDRLLRSYTWVQVVVASLGVFYFFTPYLNLMGITLFLVLARTSAAIALHVFIYRVAGTVTDVRWMARAFAGGLTAGACGAGAGLILTSKVLDLIVVPIVCLVAWALLVRTLRIFLPRDAAIARRIAPIGAPVFDLLSRNAAEQPRRLPS